MFGWTASPADRDGEISTREWNRLGKIVSGMLRLRVSAPLTLATVNGITTIGMETGLIRCGKTSGIISARVGTMKGHGTVTPYCNLADGSMAPVSGGDLVCWSKFGNPISSGTWVDFAFEDGIPIILSGDCSGNP